MPSFGEIVNNKQFGNTYQTNPLFRKAFQSYAKNPNLPLAELMLSLKMNVNETGGVSFIYGAMGNKPMSFEEAHTAWKFNRTIKSTREYFDGPGTYRTGPYSNEVANEVFGKMGLKTRVTSHSLADADDLADFMLKHQTKDKLDFYGLPIPNQEQINVLEVYNRRGQRLTSSQIARRLGMQVDSYLPKRMNILTSDRALAMARGSNDPFKVHLFDPENFFKATNPAMSKQVYEMARAEKLSGSTRSLSEIKKSIYDTMSDGLSYMTQESFESRMQDLESKAARIAASGDTQYAKSILKTVNDQREQVRKGGSFNIRVINGIDQADNRLGQIKGDVQIVPSDFVRKTFGIENPSSVDLITSMSDVKNEVKFSGFSMMTMEAQGLPSTARSNILTAATFQNMIDQDGYLATGARNEIDRHIADIKSGKITPGLKAMFEEIKAIDPTELGSPAAAKDLFESQQFIRRLEGMVSAGVPINTNDFVSGQLFNAMSKHYTRSRKGKAGQSLSFMGEQTPYYEMSFPMEGSTSAHITNLTPDDALSGTIGIDHNVGRFRLSGKDIVRMKEAFGGSDLDDRLYSILKYDESTQRLFAFVYRDPNEAGEYMIFDADIAYDKNIPNEVRRLSVKAKKLKRDIPHMERGPARELAVAELNQMNDTLHNFFSGRSVNIDNATGLNAGNRIHQIDLARMLSEPGDRPASIFAPKGWKMDVGNYKTSYYRGYGQLPDSETAIKIATAELGEEISASSGRLPFKFVGNGYSQYHSKYFKTMPVGDPTQVISTLPEKITARLGQELSSHGVLGRVVNAQSMLDEFLLSNLKGLPPELAKELDRQWRRGSFMHVVREQIIDAYTKTGDLSIIASAEEAISANFEKLGAVISNLQKTAGTSANVGLDPILFQTRLEKDHAAYAAFKRGFGAEAGFLLPENDPKAFVSRAYRQQLDNAKYLADEGELIRAGARENLLAAIEGTEFTPKQLADASDFISSMQSSSDELHKIFNSSHEELASLIGRQLNGEGVLDIDDLNTAGIRKLYDQGFLKGISDADGIKNLVPTAELDKHMVAVAKILAENNKSLTTVMAMGNQGDESLFNLYTGAMQREVYGVKALKKIDEINSIKEVSEFVTGKGKKTQFTELANQIYDPVERNIRLLNKLVSLQGERLYSASVRKEAFGIANFLLRDISQSGQVEPNDMVTFNDEIRHALDPTRPMNAHRGPVPGLRYTARQPINDAPPGLRRLSARSAADSASDAVSRTARERMTRLDKEFVSQALQDPIIRKGAIGLGIFAGIGILHRLAKDPTPEDAGGPPLLPGGNPYESYDAAPIQDMSSIYPSLNSFGSGGGMMYTVRTNGNYDPDKLSSQIGSITGSDVRNTIYKTRQVYRPRQSSQEILNGMIG